MTNSCQSRNSERNISNSELHSNLYQRLYTLNKYNAHPFVFHIRNIKISKTNINLQELSHDQYEMLRRSCNKVLNKFVNSNLKENITQFLNALTPNDSNKLRVKYASCC